MELEKPPVLKQQFSQDNFNFMINAGVLMKEFECSVCFMGIEDCHVTICGHVFCKECILESVNRHHRCPVCQGDLKDTDVFKNYHFNKIKKMILDLKQQEDQKSIDNIFKQVGDNNETKKLEEIIKNGLKKILLLYTSKFKETSQKFEQVKQNLLKELEQKSIQTKKECEQNAETLVQIQQKLQNISISYKQQIDNLDQQNQTVSEYYYQSLQKTMEEVVPSPDLLEVRVSLSIPNKNCRVESYYVQPSEFINNFETFIESYFMKRNDPIQDMDKVRQSVYLVSVPAQHIQVFNKQVIQNCKEASLDEFQQKVQQFGVADIVIKPLNCPELFMKMQLQQGSQIIVLGEIPTKSDIPPECMTYSFKKEIPQILDYFSCQDCKINWVCPGCKDFCHKGHKLQPYVQQHTAIWACCYCVSKTSNCKIKNKNSKK